MIKEHTHTHLYTACTYYKGAKRSRECDKTASDLHIIICILLCARLYTASNGMVISGSEMKKGHAGLPFSPRHQCQYHEGVVKQGSQSCKLYVYNIYHGKGGWGMITNVHRIYFFYNLYNVRPACTSYIFPCTYNIILYFIYARRVFTTFET